MKFIHLIRCNIPYVASDQMLRIMKLFIVIMTTFLMQVSASSFAQHITLKQNNISLKKVFSEIRKQTGYTVFYESGLIDKAKPINLDLSKVPLETALKQILDQQHLGYEIKNKAIIISLKAPSFLDKLVDAFTPPVDVYGVVLDEKGMPLIGATIKVKGFQQSTTTDREGKFSLKGVDDKAVLVISFIGYAPKEVEAKASVSVSLDVQSAELQEVNVAYGKTTQQALTGSVTVVKGEQIQNIPNRSFDKSLQGLIPGLQIASGSGQPGGGIGNFVLRGISTGAQLEDGSTARNPLIVIDGIPVSQDGFQLRTSGTAITNPLAQLNPSDIESISVLKDATAVALYGSRASNGVILVSTKRGKPGKTAFTFRHQSDLASLPNTRPELVAQDEYLELVYESYKNSDPVKWTDQAILSDLKSKFPVKADGNFYPYPNWYNNLYNSRALTIANEFSMSGGNGKSTFYLNLEHTNQKGIVKHTGYERSSLRFNFENRPTNWVKLGINTSLSYNKQLYSNTSQNASTFGVAEVMSPLNPIRDENGSYILLYPNGSTTSTPQENPVAANEFNVKRTLAYRGLNKIYGEINFLEGLKLTSNLGLDFMLAEPYEKSDPRLYDAQSFSTGIGRVEELDTRRTAVINSNLLTYNKTIGTGHAFNFLLGQETQIMSQKNLLVAVQNLTLPSYDQINSPGAVIQRYNGTRVKETLLSQFAQFNYDFKNRYFVSSSIRRDGSSRFGERKRFGTYWSAGLGWIVSGESFMASSSSWLSYLKVRSSVGAAGNSGAINRFTRYDVLDISTYQNGIAVYPTTIPGNPDTQWEETFSFNVGLEARFLENRVSFIFDYYKKNTSDLVNNINLPQYTGYYNVLSNIGNIRNIGKEITMSFDIIRGKKLNWNLNANWSSNKNVLTKSNVPDATSVNSQLGNAAEQSYNSFYLVRWAGVNSDTGKPQWLDVNGNLTSTYSLNNRVFVGKPQPDGFGAVTNGINISNFEISVMLYYQYGFKLYDAALNSQLNDGRFPYVNQVKSALNRWQKAGDISENPRRILNNRDRGESASTRYLFDADYIRLQNVALSYNLPPTLLKTLGLSRVKLYMQGNNLALWTKFPGKDPDNIGLTGMGTFAYPNQQSYSLGINVNF